MGTADPSRMAIASRAALLSVVSTVIVVTFKLVAAGMSGSVAVLAEGLQSLLDVALSVAVLATVRLAAAPPDPDHPWGHGKAELLMSALQMVLVVVTAAVIAWQATLRLQSPQPIRADWGLAAMGYAVVANLAVIAVLRRAAAQTESAALAGEAQHLLGDVFASLGVFGGLLAYLATDWAPLDPLVALVFTALGAGFAIRQLTKVLHPLMDGSLPAEEIARIEQALAGRPEVKGHHNLRTRFTGRLRIVTLHVLLDDDLSFVRAHELAEEVEAELSEALGGALVTVHFEPYHAETEHRRREHGDPA